MQLQKHHALQILLLSAALTLSACGGGGSSSTTTNTTGTTENTDATGSGTGGSSSGGTTTNGTPASGGTSSGGTTTGGGGTPAPTISAAECPFGDYKSAVVSEINSIRATGQSCAGVPYPAVGSLNWNGQLEAASARHSTDMAANNYWNIPFPHLGTDGTTVRDRAPAAGYNYSTVGENVAAGAGSASIVIAAWLASPSHCVAIMTSAYVDIGVSCKHNPASDHLYYWTLVMGKSF